MTTATIPRLTEPPAETQVPDTMADLDRDVLMKARSVLGYLGAEAADKADRYQRAAVSARRNLYHRLIDMGVHPLDPVAVNRYKHRIELYQWLKPLAVTLLSVAACVGMLFVAMFIHSNTLSVIVGVVTILTTISYCVGTWFYYQPSNWKWSTHSIHGYTLPIPQHVLATALQVAEGLSLPAVRVEAWETPKDGLMVEEFSFEGQVADPFLKIQLHGAEAYIAVWDEPTFKGAK